ncbi:hypothetical protein STRAU_5504 [Streptomyces aurantiacus JA 4570]|uniref:Uncharacterized protein n=1 Tax=Streptomyces aurantiacus JA 4570 TaxID=1286094 RepID=S3ZFL4_9ACTN|nr:hypothetical protein STRAU_5504 [Streptomyces aurantiacus JA 4570]
MHLLALGRASPVTHESSAVPLCPRGTASPRGPT